LLVGWLDGNTDSLGASMYGCREAGAAASCCYLRSTRGTPVLGLTARLLYDQIQPNKHSTIQPVSGRPRPSAILCTKFSLPPCLPPDASRFENGLPLHRLGIKKKPAPGRAGQSTTGRKGGGKRITAAIAALRALSPQSLINKQRVETNTIKNKTDTPNEGCPAGWEKDRVPGSPPARRNDLSWLE